MLFYYPVPRSAHSSPHYPPTALPPGAEGSLPGPREERGCAFGSRWGQCVVGSVTMTSTDGRATWGCVLSPGQQRVPGGSLGSSSPLSWLSPRLRKKPLKKAIKSPLKKKQKKINTRRKGKRGWGRTGRWGRKGPDLESSREGEAWEVLQDRGQGQGDCQQLLPVPSPLSSRGPCQMQPLAPGVLSPRLGVAGLWGSSATGPLRVLV